jgi:hypothetical protein
MASYIAAEPGVEPRENSECEDEPAESAAPPVGTETDSGGIFRDCGSHI